MLKLLNKDRKVLMLGAGFVTRPTLDILSEKGIEVTVGKLPQYTQHIYDSCCLASVSVPC